MIYLINVFLVLVKLKECIHEPHTLYFSGKAVDFQGVLRFTVELQGFADFSFPLRHIPSVKVDIVFLDSTSSWFSADITSMGDGKLELAGLQETRTFILVHLVSSYMPKLLYLFAYFL